VTIRTTPSPSPDAPPVTNATVFSILNLVLLSLSWMKPAARSGH
jgi:hypothetical protein